MAGAFKSIVGGYVFYDVTAAGNPIGRFSAVSLATAAEVATANAAGCPGNVGEIVVTTPITSGLPSRRVLGVTDGSAKSGQQVMVILHGEAFAIANAAIAFDALLFPVAPATRTSLQTPFVDNFEMLIPTDPALSLTYNLSLVDDTAKPASGTVFYSLGYALKAATAQYDIIPIFVMGGEGR
jgi:hypothetical protein